MSRARTALAAAEDALSALRNDLDAHREDLSLSTDRYGPSEILRALRGTCIEVPSDGYNYKMCFVDRVVQQQINGASETSLGYFAGVQEVDVNEVMPADGRGLGTGKRLAMKFENGQGCWHGPARRTLVVIGCAEKNEIWRVREEEKCVYRMEIGSPVGCEDGEGEKGGKAEARDEL